MHLCLNRLTKYLNEFFNEGQTIIRFEVFTSASAKEQILRRETCNAALGQKLIMSAHFRFACKTGGDVAAARAFIEVLSANEPLFIEAFICRRTKSSSFYLKRLFTMPDQPLSSFNKRSETVAVNWTILTYTSPTDRQ